MIKSYQKKKPIRLKGKKYLDFKKSIHRRDAFTCVNPACECKVDLHKPPVAYVLTVFHIIHRGRGGSDIKENVVTACNYCHELHHRGKLGNEWAIEYIKNFYG